MDERNTALSTLESPAEKMTEALVSMKRLAANALLISEKVRGKARVMGIVKANAYGHGVHKVAEQLEASGISDFGVANIHEACELKLGGVLKKSATILAFSSPLPSHIEFFLKYGIDMTVCDYATLRAAQEIASAHDKTLTIQVKIDTGMGRLGIVPEIAMELLKEIDHSSHLELKGIYTHFAESATPEGFTRQQLAAFTKLTAEYEHASSRTICKHAANSGAILSNKDSWLDMVRPGILLYGYHPAKNTHCHLDVQPVMQVESRVIFIKQLFSGSTVSYNRTWKAPKACSIATIAIGYADGYSRALSGKARVIINGKVYPQVGTVTMDQIMVDLGTEHQVRIGDRATLFGWSGLSAEELADIAGTISYEILCGVSSRVKRVFL
ncbi:MAG: alanine racemase [Chlorobium sp.]